VFQPIHLDRWTRRGGGGGSVTVSVAVGLVIAPCKAVMLVVPTRTPLARPDAVIVATAVLELAGAVQAEEPC